MNRLSRCLHYTQRVFTSGLAQQMFNPSLPGPGLLLPLLPNPPPSQGLFLLQDPCVFSQYLGPLCYAKEEQFDAVWGWGG